MTLTPEQDAYGQIMLAALEGRPVVEVLERDDGLITVPPAPSRATAAAEGYVSSYEAWPELTKRLLGYVRGRVLDIGSGAGKVPLWLQDQGHDVLASDISPLAVSVCRKRGVRRAIVGSVHDIALEYGVSFDTALFIDSFGAVGSADGLRRLLRRWLEIASEDARIIAEPLNPHLTEDPDHLAYYARNRAQGRLPGQLRMRVRYRRYCTPWFDWLLISPGEVEQVVADSGWEIEHLFTDEDAGARYGLVLRRA